MKPMVAYALADVLNINLFESEDGTLSGDRWFFVEDLPSGRYHLKVVASFEDKENPNRATLILHVAGKVYLLIHYCSSSTTYGAHIIDADKLGFVPSQAMCLADIYLTPEEVFRGVAPGVVQSFFHKGPSKDNWEVVNDVIKHMDAVSRKNT